MKVKSFMFLVNDFEKDAMIQDRSGEVAAMLRSLADKIDEYGVPNQDGRYLTDSNGNTVGSVDVKFED